VESRICKRCGLPKLIDQFARHDSSLGGRRRVCKLCCLKQQKALEKSRKSEGFCGCGREALPRKKLCKRCTQRLNDRQNRNLEQGKCRCGKIRNKGLSCQACLDRKHRYTRSIKAEVIAAYGGRCQCSCGCSISALEFLTIDHVTGGGHKHRKSVKASGGFHFYRWLKAHGYPKRGFRAMCWNCNCARGVYGYCPLEKKETSNI
jgi:hypothetical protein